MPGAALRRAVEHGRRQINVGTQSMSQQVNQFGMATNAGLGGATTDEYKRTRGGHIHRAYTERFRPRP